MKIGFDAKRAAQNRTGLGNYSRFVLRILSQQHPENEYRLYMPNPRRTPFLHEIPTIASLRQCFPPKGVWSRLRQLWRVWGVTSTLRDDWIDRQIYNYKFRHACHSADRVIAVSQYTKREIMHYYGVAEEKIDVVYQGCDKAFAAEIAQSTLDDVTARYGLPSAFALFVGSIGERNNPGSRVEALRLSASGGRAFHIVAVGRSTAYCESLKRRIAELGLADYCHFHHNVPFADLPSFYRLACLFVYPSRIEGFGIPLLEALTSGVPAVGCTGSCLEEAGGQGSIYVDPDDAEGMRKAVESVLGDETLRQRMIADGREHIKRFTDETLCADLMRVYEKTMSQPSATR